MQKVITVDCQYIFPRFAASFLLIERGERGAPDTAAFIETNTTHSVPLLLDALKKEGLTPAQVQYVIITHVHLDHAGGGFALLSACPNATLLAHPRAVPHLIDPSKLILSAREVYGDEAFEKLYGEIKPIDSARVRAIQDGEKVVLGFGRTGAAPEDQGKARTLKFIETRGHANHHSCVLDSGSQGIFTGDSFGLAYPALQKNGLFIFPSTSPTGFDAVEARKSLDKIVASGARKAFVTHFGEVQDLRAAAAQLRIHLDFCERLLEEAERSPLPDAGLTEFCAQRLWSFFRDLLRKQGLSDDPEVEKLIKLDLEINAAGLAYVAKKRRERVRGGH